MLHGKTGAAAPAWLLRHAALMFWAAVALCALAIAPCAARAEPPATRTGPWQLELTPYAWFAGLSGSMNTPLARAPERNINANFGSIVGDLSAIPIMGMAEIRYGRFGLVGDILYLGLEQGINTRDALFQGGHARVNTTIGNVLGLFRVLDLPGQSLDIGAGTRIWSVSTKLSLNPGRLAGVIQRDSVSWVDPLLAARYRIGLSERFALSVYGDIGGFGAGSTLTWQAVGSLDYRVSQSVVLRAGWRYLEVDKKRGDFRLDLGFNGPFIAATFRF